MNLTERDWLPVRAKEGGITYRSPSSIADPEILDLALPRADFQGAAYQFLIGLLQTALPPKNHDDWLARYLEPPTVEELASAFSPLAAAFELDGDRPRFMQDLDPLEEANPSPVAGLLIDSPGANGIKLNTDHFTKRGRVEVVCPDCAALALFTLQINAPSGGAGYRVGLRGGGPLTTLVLPERADATLWQRLWLNVMPAASIAGAGGRNLEAKPEDDTLFPWMGPTRVSDKKGAVVTPDEVHPLHPYWAMPRRFRLLFEDGACQCDLCGRETTRFVREIRAKNYGANYDGPWLHPLTPYRQDPKKPNEPPLSQKGQPGGLGYRHWSHLVLQDAKSSGALPAAVVHDYLHGKAPTSEEAYREGDISERLLNQVRLWAFGYDMDNMKPRCWYGVEMPLIAIPPKHEEVFRSWVQVFTELARQVAWMLRNQVKGAWFSRPADAKGDMSSIDEQFYDATEAAFFRNLFALRQALQNGQYIHMPSQVAESWYGELRREALRLFELLSLSGPHEELDMRRIIQARRNLLAWLSGRSKGSKVIQKFAKEGGFSLAADQKNKATEGMS
ncbi:type I-E CRISPR-associated protein Cse1/CasA [Billgrantia aerodenitrificans]|uniref:Type I-E CRISPR-associated protein Cse1/CasA n=1 Tax=Billgrantia aerodenitrificans TaxID=2733483 RepID=A0ABS9AYQ2_9GAMM|nr:type I-E CRISPR-associated protein Cse1/CasA [Halomonas aerodenitrificans]